MHLTPQDAQRLAGVLLEEDPGDAAPPSSPLPPGPFSRYRITRLVGVGGMGEVYEAQQDNPDRRVAIKVIRPDHLSPDLFRRFEHETRILARLQHPGIVPIYEAGQAPTPSGPMPFFAMEFVDGRPLTAFATDSNLSIKARLELFLSVCDAVEHAHRKGIIHRDLKPANILIDGRGQPRILDFGIARATDSDIRTTTLHTEVGKLIGTLPYMSPEQAGGDPDELDTRSDVYSLGVILYELLSGRPPFDFRAPGQRLIPQALRTLQQVSPARLSSISGVFRGDLDTIVGKALAKEKERRYQSVGDLSADIRRYVTDLPIVARPPSAWYHARKFAVRNRGLVAALCATGACLVVGTAVSVTLALRAHRSEAAAMHLAASESQQRSIATQRSKEAQAEAQSAKSVAEFIRRMISSVEPGNEGKDVKVADMLTASAKGIASELENQPEAAVMLRNTIAQSLLALGHRAESEEQARMAADQGERMLGASNHHTRIALANLAEALHQQNKLAEAEPIARRANDLERAALDRSDADLAAGLSNLGNMLLQLGRTSEAVEALAEAVTVATAAFGDSDRTTLLALLSYGATLKEVGRDDDAMTALSRVLTLGPSVLGADHPGTVAAMEQAASIQVRRGDAPKAVTTMRQIVEIRSRTLPENHPDTLTAISNLADGLRSIGQLDESEELFKRVIQLKQTFVGPEHPSTLATLNNYILLLRARKDYQNAEVIARQVLDVRTRRLGARHIQTLTSMYNLATVQLDAGRLDDAQELLTRVLALREEALGPAHPATLLVRGALARILKERGRPQEAIAAWRQLIEAGRSMGDGASLIATAHKDIGLCLIGSGDLAGAEAELLPAWRARQAVAQPPDPGLLSLAKALVTLYTAWNKPDEAAKYQAVIPSELAR